MHATNPLLSIIFSGHPDHGRQKHVMVLTGDGEATESEASFSGCASPECLEDPSPLVDEMEDDGDDEGPQFENKVGQNLSSC